MKRILMMCGLLCLSGFAIGQSIDDWPVFKHYDSDHLSRVALPVGGIGTGTVSISGRGNLQDWEIMNRPAKGFSGIQTGNDAPFFAIYVQENDGRTHAKGLFGPLEASEYEHMEGRSVNNHGFPRFESATFDAAYPFGRVNLKDDALPVDVALKTFNPLIPGNADDSGIPIAILRYEVKNKTTEPVEVSISGSIRNFIGRDGSQYHHNWKGDFIWDGAKMNRNEFREDGGLKGIYMYSDGVDSLDAAWGTMALLTRETGESSYRTSSYSKPDHWSNTVLNFWDDFSDDGVLKEIHKQAKHDPMASLAVKKTVPAEGSATFEFYITWHFPNRYAWSDEVVGNYYTTRYKDAWDVAIKEVPRLPELETKTRQFVQSFLASDYPETVKEAALFNLSTLRSQTVFRIKSGEMMGWEGCMDRFGSCAGSCTHVWNYEQATAFLFGDLAKTMREVEFNYATRDDGSMSFRVGLPLISNAQWMGTAADGQMGTIMKMYRDWQLSGDDEFLRNLWPGVKRAMEFAWLPDGWDGDEDGVMEGSQHNTMDVNYSGPNPQMQFWYFGALRAMEEMSKYLGDEALAVKCREIFEKGSQWVDDNLFNGEYYEHVIYDLKTKEPISDLQSPDIPEYQLGPGCLVDQLVGQYMAHICDLGYLGDKQHIKTTLASIHEYNYREGFNDHFNNMRSYVLGDEKGLVMASWPKGRLKVPFPYFAEVMTGFEYAAAVGMLYEGLEAEGLQSIANIRLRYDGAKRSPFNEAECGHHYARAMASWAAVLALSKFQWSAVNKSMTFTSEGGNYFWSNGYAWGQVRISRNETGTKAVLNVDSGTLELERFNINGVGTENFRKGVKLSAGEELVIEM
jgi:uncharacterized protein (DUF608 family)